MKVCATRRGFDGQQLRRPGDVFSLISPTHFNRRWMQLVPETEPERRQTTQEALDAACVKPLGETRRVCEPVGEGETEGEVLHDFDPLSDEFNH
jgi:hypothetical protein